MKKTIFSLVVGFLVALLDAGSAAHGQLLPELFVTAGRCMACHNALTAPSGDDASIGVDWRASMMANAARDPYWQAAVRRETLVHPMASEAIQNECSACHMPMARYQANRRGAKGSVFDHLPINAAHTADSLLAADGVSCSVCHQVQDQNLGKKESFTAGFVVDNESPRGERRVFGPFAVDAGRQRVMRSASLFDPVEGLHIQRSEVCATCHTLFTHTLDAKGQVVGELPEQVPYLEWKHSEYRDSTSCQDCHMPEVTHDMAVSSVLGVPRQNVSRHVFRGGNFFMPRIFNQLRGELGVTALPQELEATSRRATENLQTAAAGLSIDRAKILGATLSAEITISNLAGHKLPSAYPSRRVWLHLSLRDADGELLYESGRLNPDGSIEGNDNDQDGSRYEPHYELIETADQVQIYEPMMVDPDGALTTVLLSAVRYVKDNRLLPRGFDKATADEDIAVHGAASADVDFVAGGDSLRYSIGIAGAKNPLRLVAELVYQPIAFRWAHNLGQQQAPEIDRFVSAFDGQAANSAVILATAELSVN